MYSVNLYLKTIKRGKYSGLFSFDRKLTEDEQEKLQESMNKSFARFKRIVKESRGLEDDFIEDVADGSIYTGNQAKNLGLVDEVGGMSKVIEHIKAELDLDDPS